MEISLADETIDMPSQAEDLEVAPQLEINPIVKVTKINPSMNRVNRGMEEFLSEDSNFKKLGSPKLKIKRIKKKKKEPLKPMGVRDLRNYFEDLKNLNPGASGPARAEQMEKLTHLATPTQPNRN